MQAVLRALPDRIASFTGAAHDLTQTSTRAARDGLDRARDVSSALQQRLEHLAGRDRRDSRLPLAVSAVVLGAAVAGALLAIPGVRRAIRQGWSTARDRLSGAAPQSTAALQAPRQRQEDLLDEGIEESFPASDPVSVKRIT